MSVSANCQATIAKYRRAVAVLRLSGSSRRFPLEPRCIVGRSVSVQLQLAHATVSAEHASIYFDGSEWKVRDLGSTNGTFLNGTAIDSRRSHVLQCRDRLSFGGVDQQSWEIESLGPPGPSARMAGGEPLVGSRGVLWFPSPRSPDACVRFEAGRWLLEGPSGLREVGNEERVVVGGVEYVLDLPVWQGEDWSTSESTVDVLERSATRLVFSSSLDEEHVSLNVEVAGQSVSLGARSHNYPLLLLARRRLEDQARGIEPKESGWLYASDLRDLLALDRVALNLQLWRAKQAFQSLSLPTDQLVERRPDSGQLRIGFERLVVK
jgi:pSer/pThr/pTyr-binding forkhead associated (FHA) protein